MLLIARLIPIRGSGRSTTYTHKNPGVCRLSGSLVVGVVEVRGEQVGGVPIEAVRFEVIAACRARVGVTSEVLHISERRAGVECGRDCCMAQAVGRDSLRDSDALSSASTHRTNERLARSSGSRSLQAHRRHRPRTSQSCRCCCRRTRPNYLVGRQSCFWQGRMN